eukprot:m.195416 g.195416  ORF g.195416 m.195416 type:complete len:58 (+) comp15230_c0_seq3:1574-1747(+)
MKLFREGAQKLYCTYARLNYEDFTVTVYTTLSKKGDLTSVPDAANLSRFGVFMNVCP